MLSIETIDKQIDWNNALATLPHAHILQTWEWGQFKYETTGWIPHRWAFKQGDELVAMCSMGERRLGPFSVMYTPKGPAMDYSDSATVQAVLDALKARARAHRAIWLKIDPDIAYATGIPDEDDDTPAEPGATVKRMLKAGGWRFSDDQIQFRNTVTLDLTQSDDDLLMAMSGNTRRKVRQAYKKDVTIRPASADDVDLLYRLYDITGDRNDFLIRPAEYYLKLWRYFMNNDRAHALIAEYEGRAIAHVILFHFGETCWYFYGASSNEERQRMPNYALQWEAMKWAQRRGYRTYDMWGAPDHFTEEDPMWGVFMFKQGFRGTVERRLGAWDYAPNGSVYQVYTQAIPRLRDWMRSLRS
ncbi:MAG: lipid II:glycine glycyltransferase FemX [Anaerolineae bacterium]